MALACWARNVIYHVYVRVQPSRRKMFTPETKRAAIEAYLADPSKSFDAVAKLHGVPKRSLQTWVRQEKPDSVVRMCSAQSYVQACF